MTCFHFRLVDVPWLNNYQEEDHPSCEEDSLNSHTSIYDRQCIPQSSHLTFYGFVLESIKRLLYVAGYISTLAINFHLLLNVEKKMLTTEFLSFVVSLLCTSIMSIYLLLSVIQECVKTPHYETTLLSKVCNN